MTKETADAIADRVVTAEELFDHPEWGRCELKNGRVKFMSPAGGEHGEVAGMILGEIYAFVRSRKLGRVLTAETGFIVSKNPDTVRAPDVMFVNERRVPPTGIPKNYLTIAPDLAVEVVSPSDTYSEITEKAESYIAAGVKLVWIVDPQMRKAHVYKPGAPVQTLSANESLSGDEVLPGFELALKELFK